MLEKSLLKTKVAFLTKLVDKKLIAEFQKHMDIVIQDYPDYLPLLQLKLKAIEQKESSGKLYTRYAFNFAANSLCLLDIDCI